MKAERIFGQSSLVGLWLLGLILGIMLGWWANGWRITATNGLQRIETVAVSQQQMADDLSEITNKIDIALACGDYSGDRQQRERGTK